MKFQYQANGLEGPLAFNMHSCNVINFSVAFLIFFPLRLVEKIKGRENENIDLISNVEILVGN